MADIGVDERSTFDSMAFRVKRGVFIVDGDSGLVCGRFVMLMEEGTRTEINT